MFSQDTDFNSQNYHTSISQRLPQPSFGDAAAAMNNNNNNNISAHLSDLFANAVIKASVAMGGEEVGPDSHINASQLAASQYQFDSNNSNSSSSPASLNTNARLSDFELSLARYCDGTWHTQQYLSSFSADDRRRHALLASQSFQQSLDIDSHFAFSHYGASLMNLLEKNFHDAFSNARMALLKMGTQAPNHVRFVLGISALRLDRSDIAEKCFARICSISNNQDPLGHIGTFLFSIGRKDIVGIAEALLSLQQTLPQLPLELIQKSADMIFLQCWPTPEEKRGDSRKNENANFNANIIRQKIHQVSESLFDVIRQSRLHPNCTPELSAYADFQEGRLRAALAVEAGSERAAGIVDKDEMTLAQRLLYRASRNVVPAIPHLVRATFHSLGKEAALVQALQGFNRIAKLGLVPFRELFEMTTILLLLNNQHEGAVRMAKQLVDTIGVANSEAWFNASFVNRLDEKNACEQSKQAVSIEETIKDGANANGDDSNSLVCTSGEEESKVRTNIASLAVKADFQGDEDPAHPLNRLYNAADAFNAYEDESLKIDLRRYLNADSMPREAPSAELLPLIFNFALMNEATGKKQVAVRIYTQLVKWFPQEQTPFFRLANIALENKDVMTCIHWMQLCVSVSNPGERAQCYSMMARALASSAATSGTGTSTAAGNAAAYKLLTGDEGKAILEVSNPRQQAVLYSCAGACLAHDAQGGQHVQMKAGAALRLFRQALRLDPESSAAAHGIACCVALLGASEQASALLERIISERTPDVIITRVASENLFNAYINTAAYRQALRMEQLRSLAYPNATIARDRMNSIVCALTLTNRYKEAVDRVVALVQENPRHALTNFTAVLVVMSYVLSSVESMTMPKTEETAAQMSTLLDSCLRWSGFANQLKDRSDSTSFIRHLVAYIKKLDLQKVIQKFVTRSNRMDDEYQRWQEEWRAENTQRTREAEAKRDEADRIRHEEEERERLAREAASEVQRQQTMALRERDAATLLTANLNAGGDMVAMMGNNNNQEQQQQLPQAAYDEAGLAQLYQAEQVYNQTHGFNNQQQQLLDTSGNVIPGSETQAQIEDPMAGFDNPFDRPSTTDESGQRRQREDESNNNNNSAADATLGENVDQLVEAAQQHQAPPPPPPPQE